MHGGARTIHKNWYAAASGPVAILFNASSPKQLIGGEKQKQNMSMIIRLLQGQ